jgi:serralysin
MKGGLGADIFQFLNLADSKKNHLKSDVILDFRHAQNDKIDLSAIDANSNFVGDQAFKFIGSQGFHDKARELHFTKDGNSIFVEGDVNGDGNADFAIKVADISSIAKIDFIL